MPSIPTCDRDRLVDIAFPIELPGRDNGAGDSACDQGGFVWGADESVNARELFLWVGDKARVADPEFFCRDSGARRAGRN